MYIYDLYIIVFKTRAFVSCETVGFGSKMGHLPAAQQHLVKCFLRCYIWLGRPFVFTLEQLIIAFRCTQINYHPPRRGKCRHASASLATQLTSITDCFYTHSTQLQIPISVYLHRGLKNDAFATLCNRPRLYTRFPIRES
jgi:hypothetical protein